MGSLTCWHKNESRTLSRKSVALQSGSFGERLSDQSMSGWLKSPVISTCDLPVVISLSDSCSICVFPSVLFGDLYIQPKRSLSCAIRGISHHTLSLKSLILLLGTACNFVLV